MTTKLFTSTEFKAAIGKDMLAFECERCSITFYKTKQQFVNGLRYSKNAVSYCSRECYHNSRGDRAIKCECAQCGAMLTRMPFEVKNSKSGRQFCSQSCAATYNNLHKTTGARRSKLEAYLEVELTRLYHDLDIIYNSKDAIDSELDIYIPSLRLAFEINGIYHYEPIHGQDKLDSILVNDSHKFRDCIAGGISLCVIDTSRQGRFTISNSTEYVKIICDIIDSYL